MMPRLRVHFDGWIVLPSTLLERLGLDGEAELELEVEDGAAVLRPVGQPARQPEPATAARAVRPAAAPPQESEKVAAPVARQARPGAREGERVAAGRKRAPAVASKLLPALNARGRRRKAQEA